MENLHKRFVKSFKSILQSLVKLEGLELLLICNIDIWKNYLLILFSVVEVQETIDCGKNVEDCVGKYYTNSFKLNLTVTNQIEL